ncbi:cyanophycin synthetase [Clostridium amazonitimonense]|uniref:cyanophycin synthetase n=1 Tax=Clostridium amazonitimonense TaxID=1499689 RepID=UPI000509A708|nr:cyanophycin synthetase [Clostridium amazonitimonense]
MKITSYRVFEGRNIYSHKKCIKLEVDLEGYRDIPSKDIPGFNENLVELVPELKKHRCGIDEEGGFVKRLKEGTYLAHICEHIIIGIHNTLGMDISYGKAREINLDKYYIIFQYIYPRTALSIAKLSVDIVNALIKNKSVNMKYRLKDIKAILNTEIIGPSTEALCNAAKNREIPVLDVNNSGIYQLGYGRYGKMIDATVVDSTRSIGVDIACDKWLTKKMLQNQYIPVAEGGVVKSSLELLIQGKAIGYPVVLKPRFGNQGKGVILDIKNEKELLQAYEDIKVQFNDIIIEKYIKGNDYRVCVIDDQVIAVSLRIPPYVIGDGKSTIKELIEGINRDDRRGEEHEKPLTKIKIDDSLIKTIGDKGYKLRSILKKDEKIYLRRNANLSTGGFSIDCTDLICEENIKLCKRIAKTIGLDVCGIDICCHDISIPLNLEGIVMEVNAAPGIRMHHYPNKGKERDVAGAIVDMLFKNSPSSVPIVSITGTNGKTTTTRLISHTLSLIGYKVGMTTTGGIYIDNECIEQGDTTGFTSARTVLSNKEIDMAVLETARGGIIRKGLAYDLADVGVITNIREDHLGIDGVNTIEDLAHVKSLIIESVKDEGYSVLNADDEESLKIIKKARGKLILFSKYKDNKYIKENIKNGGYGVYIYDNSIYVEKEKKIFHIADVEDIPITFQGKLDYNIENALAAVSALVGLEIDYCMISKGITSFKSDEDNNPGRFNMYEINGVTVVLDYGHNLDGYKAVVSGLKKLEYNNLIAVIGVPGDRTDESVLEIGKFSGENFNRVYIKEDKDKRGRRKGEIARLLYKGAVSSAKNPKYMEIILEEEEALQKAIDNAESGDIVMVFFENYTPLRDLIKKNQLEVQKKVGEKVI